MHTAPRRAPLAPFAPLAAALVGLLVLATSPAAAQTTPDLILRPWEPGRFVDTHDKLLYQAQSHEQGKPSPAGSDDDAKAQIFWWDSYGRVRFGRDNPDAPAVGYRYLTVALDTSSPRLPDNLDDVSLAAGLHLGEFAGGKASAVVGAGYSSDNLFGDPSAYYGVGHLIWDRRLDNRNSLVLTLDYDGNSLLLPDVPLPGFRFVHRRPGLEVSVGYPQSALHWEPLAKVTVDLSYVAPFNGQAEVAYHFTKELAAVAGYTQFFNAFDVDGDPATRRLFYRMSQVEVGVRYRDDAAFWGIGIDADLVVGYAFDQEFSRGWDVRDLTPLTSLSDAPYVGVVLRGRF
jgi:hypothetical protein